MNLSQVILCVTLFTVTLSQLIATTVADQYCVAAGINARWSPCGEIAFLSSGFQGELLQRTTQSCLGGTYEWFYLKREGGGQVWVANVNGNSVWACGGGASDNQILQGSLQDTITRIGQAVASRSPRTDVSITVKVLNNGQFSGNLASYRGDETHVSASSAKAMWVGAALKGRGVAPVQPFAGPVFKNSDNDATGSVIDLINPNAVNDYYQSVGMGSSGFCRWGANRIATNCPRAMGSDNYFTANDCVSFLEKLALDQIPYSAQLKQWMTWAPRSGVGGWLAAKLPAAAGVSHKAGWLPPGSTSSDSYYNTLNDIGIVTSAKGVSYAVSILARRGSDYWGAQVRYAEWASCMIYRKVTGEALSCS